MIERLKQLAGIEPSRPGLVEARRLPPKEVVQALRTLRWSSSVAGGHFISVEQQKWLGKDAWVCDPKQREREDHWPESQGSWVGQYVIPLQAAAQKALDKKLGKGVLVVDNVNEKGRVWVAYKKITWP